MPHSLQVAGGGWPAVAALAHVPCPLLSDCLLYKFMNAGWWTTMLPLPPSVSCCSWALQTTYWTFLGGEQLLLVCATWDPILLVPGAYVA